MTKKVIVLPIIIIMLIANIYQLNILNENQYNQTECHFDRYKNLPFSVPLRVLNGR